jgi:hypothetical protein
MDPQRGNSHYGSAKNDENLSLAGGYFADFLTLFAGFRKKAGITPTIFLFLSFSQSG